MAWRSSRPPSSDDSDLGGGGGFGDGAGRWAARSLRADSDSLVFREKPGNVGDSGWGGGGGGGESACDAEDRLLEPADDLLDGVADGRFCRCSHAMAASSSELSLSDSSCWSSVNSCVDDRSLVSFSGV